MQTSPQSKQAHPCGEGCGLPTTLIVGLGNDLLSDDGVGVYVARRLRDCLDPSRFAVRELAVGGIHLVESLLGFCHAIVIDACRTGRYPPGTVTRHDAGEFTNSLRLAPYHAMAFPDALELARWMGASLPRRIDVFAIEVLDIETVGERCTPAVEAGIDNAADEIARFLEIEVCESRRHGPPARDRSHTVGGIE